MILKAITQKYQVTKQNGLICELGVAVTLLFGVWLFGVSIIWGFPPEKRALVLSFPISLRVISQKIYPRQSELGKSKCY